MIFNAQEAVATQFNVGGFGILTVASAEQRLETPLDLCIAATICILPTVIGSVCSRQTQFEML